MPEKETAKYWNIVNSAVVFVLYGCNLLLVKDMTKLSRPISDIFIILVVSCCLGSMLSIHACFEYLNPDLLDLHLVIMSNNQHEILSLNINSFLFYINFVVPLMGCVCLFTLCNIR